MALDMDKRGRDMTRRLAAFWPRVQEVLGQGQTFLNFYRKEALPHAREAKERGDIAEAWRWRVSPLQTEKTRQFEERANMAEARARVAEASASAAEEENARLRRDLEVHEFLGDLEGQDRRVMEAKVKQLDLDSRTDGRTGIPNSRRYEEYFDDVISRVSEADEISFLFIDIDHFKRFNSAHGHPEGDVALRQVAQAMQQALGEGDFLARYGGEEFVIILINRDAALVAENILNAIHDNPYLQRHKVTVSIGAQTVNGAEVDSTIRDRANVLLREAKAQGRNQALLVFGDGAEPVKILGRSVSHDIAPSFPATPTITTLVVPIGKPGTQGLTP